ncbi:uncharacterized protein BT62DRAFT_1012474 [Guyanagaster necrorhizus]|uniref:Zn(2)-C6 fungal-type domain-containing protein n=1 Tax=Guyanagaster necrorhizus TaxID=856835 RepID=A0A9P7VIR3_9AGAR|nr:uncharacterized protein BT62DRAFT_1012474 [Guyanagaster necrorhizus MCA 3950]KAG7440699.1 hypothetical protein BT62DRAFT_1012474 [Guyanagaster necrorhizus MCA 3950]
MLAYLLHIILNVGTEICAMPSTSASNKQPERAPRRTLMACEFCRGRKLKCDGNRPSCANCRRRQIACTYKPVNANK